MSLTLCRNCSAVSKSSSEWRDTLNTEFLMVKASPAWRPWSSLLTTSSGNRAWQKLASLPAQSFKTAYFLDDVPKRPVEQPPLSHEPSELKTA